MSSLVSSHHFQFVSRLYKTTKRIYTIVAFYAKVMDSYDLYQFFFFFLGVNEDTSLEIKGVHSFKDVNVPYLHH